VHSRLCLAFVVTSVLNARTMRTDKEIFRIFQKCPEFIFDLAGLDDHGPCSVESVTIKSLQRSMDGLVRPDDPRQPLTVVEVQFQRSETIYNRVVIEMAAIQEDHGMREIRGIVFFAARSLDPAVRPWTSVVQSVMLDEALAAREEKFPDDPAVAVFKPVFEPDKAKLEKAAAAHYRAIRTSAKLSTDQAEALAEVFLHGLLERFRDKTDQEIAMILDLPDIEDTRAGKDLMEKGMERGLERGREEGREEGLESSIVVIARKRFEAGQVDARLEAAIRDLGTRALEQLLDELLDLPDADALRQRVEDLA
jgi:predicted transposase YdaD